MTISAVILSSAMLPNIQPQKVTSKLKYGVKDVIGNPIMLGSLVATFSLQFTNSVFSSFIPLYARQLPLAIIGLVFAVQGLMNVVGRPVVGELSTRIRRRIPTVSLAMLLGTAGMLSLGISSSLEVIIISAILVGLSMGIGIVLLLTMVAEQSPREKRGFVMGFHTTPIYLGLGFGSAVEGIVIENFGYPIAFQSFGLLTLTGLIGFGLLSSRMARPVQQ